MKNIAIISESLDNDETDGKIIEWLSRELSKQYNVYLFLLKTDDIIYAYEGTIIDIGQSGVFYEYSIKLNKKKYNIDAAISFSTKMNIANIRTRFTEKVIISEKIVQILEGIQTAAQDLKKERYYYYADEIVTYTSADNRGLHKWINVIEKRDNKICDALEHDRKFLDSAKKIVVFGAGYVGKSCYLRLSSKYNIDCFAVSKRDENKTEYIGVEIKEIKEVTPEDTTVVIGVGDAFQDEIVFLLKQRKFSRIVFPYVEPLEYEYYINTPNLNIRKELVLWYQLRMERVLNLDNPRTFNEKIQWLKINDCSTQKTILADKVLVRDYIKQKIGEQYLIPALGIWNSFDEIDFSLLPDSFVMKCNHGSGTNIIVRRKIDLNMRQAKQKMDEWMKMNYAYKSGFELQYANIVPRILIEKYLQPDGEELKDYKFMCFSGKVKCSFVCTERYSKDGLKVTFFDRDWNVMSFERHYPISKVPIEKPRQYDKMIELAEFLSKDFKFVRIDFYEYKDKIYFGEFTFSPGSGAEEFTPEKWDYELGEWIDL